MIMAVNSISREEGKGEGRGGRKLEERGREDGGGKGKRE